MVFSTPHPFPARFVWVGNWLCLGGGVQNFEISHPIPILAKSFAFLCSFASTTSIGNIPFYQLIWGLGGLCFAFDGYRVSIEQLWPENFQRTWFTWAKTRVTLCVVTSIKSFTARWGHPLFLYMFLKLLASYWQLWPINPQGTWFTWAIFFAVIGIDFSEIGWIGAAGHLRWGGGPLTRRFFWCRFR